MFKNSSKLEISTQSTWYSCRWCT